MGGKWRRILLTVFAILFGAQWVIGADQFINCRKFGGAVKIKIDGDPADWPISSYGDPATLPDIPEEEQFSDIATTHAMLQDPMTMGDHFVYDFKKVLFNSGAKGTADAWAPTDFAATTYVAWDSTGLYVLNSVTDSTIGWENGQANRDTGNAPAYTNDGIELWFDCNNDRLPENINTDQTSEADLQLDISIDDAITLEEFGSVVTQANGNPLEIQIFRSPLNTDNEEENKILAQIQHAAKLDNKGIGNHTSYVQEILVPWQVFPDFDSSHGIGFNINWVNWEFTTFILMRWLQANESEVMYFREMRFTSDAPLGQVSIFDWPLF